MSTIMFLYRATIFLTTISCTLASQTWITRKPVPISPCSDDVLKKCPKLPSPQNCAVFYTPPGKCCRVCACQDDKGNVYSAPESFVIHKKTNCRRCYCVSKNGTRTATCYREDCTELQCPRRLQSTQKNSCCMQCNPGWKVQTFSPITRTFKRKMH